MKTNGVLINLSENTGFTLPLNMGELGNISELDLSNCSLTGPYSYIVDIYQFMVNQFTKLFFSLFCLDFV